MQKIQAVFQTALKSAPFETISATEIVINVTEILLNATFIRQSKVYKSKGNESKVCMAVLPFRKGFSEHIEICLTRTHTDTDRKKLSRNKYSKE